LLDLENDLESNTSRVITMEEHLRNVNQEAQQTKELHEARRLDLDTQTHLVTVSKGEAQRLAKEIKSTQTELDRLTDVQNEKQNQVFKAQQQIDGIKQKMKWGEKQLQEWLQAAQEREDDADVLQKYTLVDEAKVKELTLAIGKLTDGSQRDQALLDKEVTETHSHELGLDKVSIIFRQLHSEKRQLIDRWETTLNEMQGRDDAIQQAAETFQRLKADANERNKTIKEQEGLLTEEQTANEDEVRKTQMRERTLDHAQQNKHAVEEELQRFTNELDSLRNTLATTESQRNKRAAEVKALQATAEDWVRKIEQVEHHISDTSAEVKGAKARTMSVEEQTRQLEKMLDQEEGKLTERHSNLSRVQAHFAAQSQRVTELKHEEQTIVAEISATSAMLGNMNSKIRTLSRQKLDEETLLYKQDFEIAQLERKLSRMEGKVSDAENKEMAAKIKLLRSTLTEQQSSEKLLKTQIQKLDEELRLSRKRSEKDTQKFETLSGKLAELELEIKRSQEDLNGIISKKQELMVNENVLKLEIRRNRMQLNRRADDVFSLEQSQLQLQAAMDERMDEILIHKQLLSTQLKAANDQRSVVNKELIERKSRIEQLKKRHEIILFSTAASEDGETKSQAYLLVQAAQEREELQALGDKLDTKIRKGEKEIRQLETVLFKMTGKNHRYREGLLKVGENDEDTMQKEQLEAQLRSVMDLFRHNRRERNALQSDVEQLRENAAHLDDQLQGVRKEVNDTKAAIANLDAELAEQQGKRDRAVSFAKQIVKLHRKDSGSPREETTAEMDFRLKESRDFNAKILDMMDGLVAQNPGIATEVSMLYGQVGIDASKMRSKRGMGSTASGTSVRSSVAGSRGGARSIKAAPTANAAAAAAARRGGAVTPKTFSLGL
jgi:UDP-glucose:O-linked fucose beta-1,3-glucosyltransferase